MALVGGEPQIREVIIHVAHGMGLIRNDLLEPFDLALECRHISSRTFRRLLGVSGWRQRFCDSRQRKAQYGPDHEGDHGNRRNSRISCGTPRPTVWMLLAERPGLPKFKLPAIISTVNIEVR